MRIGVLLLFTLILSGLNGQDSLNMERIGRWDPNNMPSKSGVIYNDVWGYTASDGSEFAILGNVDSILFINVSNPTNPVRKFGFDGGNRAIWRDFKVFEDYAYAVCDGCSEGLHIFDMSALPGGQISHVATIDTFFSRAHNIYIDTISERLYACGTNVVGEGLVVIDISTPNVPVRLANLRLDIAAGQESANFYVHDLYVKEDTAYCSHGYKGYYIWDLNDLANASILGYYNSPGYNHSSWINDSGDYAYYAEEIPKGQPLAVVDLANLGVPNQNIQIVKTFKDPISNQASNVTPHNPFVKEDTLYLSYYEDGMKIYDLSNPSNPDLIAYYDTYPGNGLVYNGYDGAWGAYPFFESGNLLISDVENGLNILRVQTCTNSVTYYKDFDEDGFGDPNNFESSCSYPEGYVLNSLDCDDSDSSISPNAIEVCDGIDNDCDGLIDTNDPDIQGDPFYLDNDNDGFGDPNTFILDCEPPAGYVRDNTDCDDSNNMVNPGFPEVCDRIDNNCDGIVDRADPSWTNIDWYIDSDNDNFGTDASVINSCERPIGYSAFDTDCDDNNAEVYPFNTEACDNIDNNCDGVIDENCPVEICDGTDLSITQLLQNTYRAKNTIVSSNIVLNNMSSIEFFAGSSIELNSDFEVDLGTSFLATIMDCQLTTSVIIDIDSENIIEVLQDIPNNSSINFKNKEMLILDSFGDIQLIQSNLDLQNYLKEHFFSSFKLKIKPK